MKKHKLSKSCQMDLSIEGKCETGVCVILMSFSSSLSPPDGRPGPRTWCGADRQSEGTDGQDCRAVAVSQWELRVCLQSLDAKQSTWTRAAAAY